METLRPPPVPGESMPVARGAPSAARSRAHDGHYECPGLEPGDVVRAVDGAAARDPDRWPDVLGPGTRPSALEVERVGEAGTRTTTLGRRG